MSRIEVNSASGPTQRPLPFLKGKRLYLRPLAESDVEGPYLQWFNDEEVCRGSSRFVFPFTFETAMDYIRHAAQTQQDLILAIVLCDGHRHIGNIALKTIHPVYRSADFAIVIGDRSVWGQGYGKEAGKLLCDHGFRALNLNRIYCGMYEDNTAMKKLAFFLGMREEGRRRQAAFKQGRYVDVIEYGVLQPEYEARWRTS